MTDTQREFEKWYADSFADTTNPYHKRGFENCWQAALAHSQQWISVDTAQPENMQEVLIYAVGVSKEYPHVIVVAQYHKEANEFNQYDLEVDYYCQPTVDVTHWMPLPQPPITNRKDE